MELTPPPSLVRSPASPTHTYCPSERSSLDYPSPGLVDQQYRLSSIYGDQSCAVSPPMEPDTSLPPLDSIAQHEWNTLHPTSASVMPSILSPEYDSFGSYSYSHDPYHPQSPNHPSAIHAPTPPPTSSAPRSPVAPPRTTMPPYTPVTSMPPLTPRIKMEGGPEYNQTMEAAQYPSPRSAQTPSYPSENGLYAGSSTSGYLSDGTTNTTAWSKPEYQPLETDHLYPPPPLLQPTPFLQDVKRFRMQRPRRQQRRLTTKEEANFICEFKGCGKMFSRSYNYKAHLETHDEKREYPFPCQVPNCNKRFVRKTDLQRHHASVHLRERTHKCDYCGRMFARKDTLRRLESRTKKCPEYSS